ncbi:glutamate 5-kinase [Kutzneria chonburiensis]|uniref:Glutamate 5-kinase n=1 Tax=Kutzneria chonburiensis TaxID=1483604 RepID=A0ABV6MR22_9PSEU
MLTNTPADPSPATGTRAGSPAGSGDRVVLKIGTSSLVTDGRLDPAKLDRLCDTVHRGVIAGLSPVLVTSGAIAIGRTRHPALAAAGTVVQQVAAALGQSRLYSAIQAAFADRGLQTGQLLLTPYELVEAHRGGVRHTLETMLTLGMIPVVNENDALGVRNNDVLAALLSGFLQADLLLLLTDVPGLYDRDPTRSDDARPIGDVVALTPELERLAGGSAGGGGTGGMRMKLGACWIATFSGVRTVIADTTDPDVLVAAHSADPVGTAFRPRAVTGATPGIGTLWRAFRTPPRGSVRCAPAGLSAVERGETLRHQHIVESHQTFDNGDVVDICAPDGRPVARGEVRCAGPCTADPASPLVAAGDYVRIVEEQPCL